MRFMMLMIPKGYEKAAAGATPDPKIVAAMMKYNEALQKAGVLLALDGLHPPAMGARVSFSGGKPMVSDGPFAEAKEVLGGYWMISGEIQGRSHRVGQALPRCRQRSHRDSSGPGDVGLPSGRQGSRGRIRRPSSAVQENEVNSTLRFATQLSSFERVVQSRKILFPRVDFSCSHSTRKWNRLEPGTTISENLSVLKNTRSTNDALHDDRQVRRTLWLST
jgi:hypothetical protein